MKIIETLKNRQVIDCNGNVVGKINDFDWDLESKEVKNLIVIKKDSSKKIMSNDEVNIGLENVDAIGEYILLNESFDINKKAKTLEVTD